MEHIVYLSLGSNLGDRQKNIGNAIHYLKEEGIILTTASSFFMTEPVGFLLQPEFLNQVIKAETSLSPQKLLQLVLMIENEIGRIRVFHWGPRIIDIDILLYDDSVVKQKNLIIPHQELHKRNFVLIPLVEIEPELIHPVLKKKMKDLITDKKGSVKKIQSLKMG